MLANTSSADINRQGARIAMTKLRVEQFLKEFVPWATDQSNVEAVALVGSYARGTATETSDEFKPLRALLKRLGFDERIRGDH